MAFTVTVTAAPDAAETPATVPLAVPETVATKKSSVVILLALSSKVTVKSMVSSFRAGDPFSVIDCAAGGVVSAGPTEGQSESSRLGSKS